MRVLAINDVSCVGKCSLTVALPIISACGITCDILPTAILSTHTSGFENYTFLDYSSEIPSLLKQWRSLGLRYDCICSGYLGNIDQIDMVRQIKNEFLKEDGIFIVDPVMGDGGKLYPHFQGAFPQKMAELCKVADYILPNLTEACYLTNTNYDGGKADVKKLIEILKGTRTCPIVTGVEEGDTIGVAYLKDGEICQYSTPLISGYYHGAGDVFSAAFCGVLMATKSLEKAVRFATDFTKDSIARTKDVKGHEARYGLFYEEEIFSLLQKLQREK